MISKALRLALALIGLAAVPAAAQNTTWQPLGGRSGVPPSTFYNQNHTWTGQQAQPKCPLIEAAIIAINASCANGSGLYTVTLTGNRILGFPSNTSKLGVQWFTLEISQDSTGTRNLTPEAGYAFPFANVNADGGLHLSTLPKTKDVITCWNISAIAWDCSGPQVSVSPYVHFVQHSRTDNNNTGVSSQATTLTGFTAGHTVILFLAWCRDGTTCTTSNSVDTTTVTATGGVCTQIAASITSTSAPTKAYRCTGMATGSVTFTANFAGATSFFGSTDASEMINDQGAEAAVSGVAASGTSLTLTSGTLSQPNGEFVMSAAWAPNQSNPSTIPTPAIILSQSNGFTIAGFINSGCSSCTQVMTYTWVGSTANSGEIFALKTP